ncbi:hypothetical protein ASF72_18480 [Arthrobacter sp. Leaf141]|uniref:hypothetical protein n=1 Tax=Arthrobacter sp. Leaf141 TaxID=1736273 RepID=UPI0006FCE6A3|nr:hypothetical protein [Arthrobacter sp. Leaf141]KQQ98429.1 hypothetical protein ASF72_18480 [Arthrobacter sp. Leaf141]
MTSSWARRRAREYFAGSENLRPSSKTVSYSPAASVAVFMAVDVTTATHILGRRRTFVGVGIGTAVEVPLVDLA